MKLTQPDLAQLSVGEYRDDEVRGLVFRVRPTGLRSFELRYTLMPSGRRARMTIGGTDVMKLSDARRKARDLIAGVWTGGDPQKELRRRGGLTIGDLANRYLSSAALSDPTKREWGRLLKTDLAPLLNREASTLRRGEIRDFGSAIAKRSGYVANRVFEILRRFYSWGVSKDLLDGTPFVQLSPPFEGEVESGRFLRGGELRALAQALDYLADDDGRTFGNAHHVEATHLLLLTGVRRRAVIEARKSDLFNLHRPDDAEWRIRPLHQKLREKDRTNAKSHVVPLSRQAVEIFRRRLEATGGAEILFPRTGYGFGRKTPTIWWSSKFVAKLRSAVNARLHEPAPPWTIHNFRHTVATLGEEILSIPRFVMDGILQHVDGSRSSTAIYSRATHLHRRRAALQDWADWIDSLRWCPMERKDSTQ